MIQMWGPSILFVLPSQTLTSWKPDATVLTDSPRTRTPRFTFHDNRRLRTLHVHVCNRFLTLTSSVANAVGHRVSRRKTERRKIECAIWAHRPYRWPRLRAQHRKRRVRVKVRQRWAPTVRRWQLRNWPTTQTISTRYPVPTLHTSLGSFGPTWSSPTIHNSCFNLWRKDADASRIASSGDWRHWCDGELMLPSWHGEVTRVLRTLTNDTGILSVIFITKACV